MKIERLLLLKKLLADKKCFDLRKSLCEINEEQNKNYSLLFSAINDQHYDENGNLVKGYRGAILEGSSRCFHPEQLIVTSAGNKFIKDLKINDECLSFNHFTQKNEYKRVSNVMKQSNTKKAYRIVLKDGTEIKCTHDHKFFYQGRYVEIENILSLLKK